MIVAFVCCFWLAMSASKRQKLPGLQIDSIDLGSPHLKRTGRVKETLELASSRTRVVVGGSPSTGKSSLLELLADEIRQSSDDEVYQADVYGTEAAISTILEELRNYYSISTSRIATVDAFKERKNKVWILFDECQNAYGPKFDEFWAFLFKTLVKYPLDKKLIIVAATTYDETLGPSPTYFEGLDHASPHFSLVEAQELYHLHTQHWQGMKDWEKFRDALLGYASLNGDLFHTGVIMAGMFLLSPNCKRDDYTEDEALIALRSPTFVNKLERCFTKPETLPSNAKEEIANRLIQSEIAKVEVLSSELSFRYVRRGLFNKYGGFSCMAANLYYNTHFFPGRAIYPPESLEWLVVEAVKSMSKRRISVSRDQGNFPKEAVFQQLFNEAANKLLPVVHTLIPELNTKAIINGKVVTGELDFYINSNLKWSIELLVEGRQIGDHLSRFAGKYSEVDTQAYLVVDFRGPRQSHGVPPNANRCTFYFADDFSSCVCKMRLTDEFIFNLQA